MDFSYWYVKTTSCQCSHILQCIRVFRECCRISESIAVHESIGMEWVSFAILWRRERVLFFAILWKTILVLEKLGLKTQFKMDFLVFIPEPRYRSNNCATVGHNQSYFGPHFLTFGQNMEILCNAPYSVLKRENVDQKNFGYGLFSRC